MSYVGRVVTYDYALTYEALSYCRDIRLYRHELLLHSIPYDISDDISDD